MRTIKRIITLSLTFIFVSLILIDNSKINAFDNTHYRNLTRETNYIDGDGSYYEYIATNDNSYPQKIIHVDIFSPHDILDEDFSSDGTSIRTSENGSITWEFEVEESGFYNLNLDYYPLEGKGTSIQRTIKIDNEVPFEEAKIISFYRLWKDSSNTMLQEGNEVRPSQTESPKWINYNISDRSKLIDGDYMFFLKKGLSYLTIESVREPMAIKSISFLPVKSYLSYDEILINYQKDNLKEIKLEEPIQFEAENASLKSSSSLYAVADNSSPYNSPYHLYKIRLNTIGGTNWQTVGDFIEWEFEVPEEGLYEISLRYKQDVKTDLPTVRTLYVNGEIPFSECKEIEFPYGSKFQILTIGDNNVNYLFHLNAGKNTIRLETSLGRYRAAIEEIQTIIDDLSLLYREIIVVTGVNPDVNRDYELLKYIPSLKTELNERKLHIEKVLNMILDSNHKKTKETVILNKIKDQLVSFINNTHSIAKNISLFQSNISSLGTSLNDLMVQPLRIDYFQIRGNNNKVPKADANFFGQLWFEIKRLVVSFFVDYDSLGSSSGDYENNIEIWVLSGRDQAQIIKNLVISSFTAEHEIGVTIRVVNASALLPNTLVGKGPDIAMMVDSDLPVQYAFRNAVYDLTSFDDFYEIIGDNFYNASILNLTYNGGVYGLPDTAGTPVLFYRKDIIVEQLGLEIPNTWNELTDMMADLQRSNMDVYLGQPGNVLTPDAIDSIYSSMLLQRGGYFYNEVLTKTALNSDVAIETFIDWTKIFTQHSGVVSSNFLTRFRSGQMPIGISDYSFSNSLSMYAPEIDGKWEMALLPGTYDEFGNIHRDALINGTASVIIKQTKNPKAAWEFMKWWASTNTQLTYGREVEASLGRAARYQTANINAIDGLAWQKQELLIIKEQLSNGRGLDQVPGGTYMTGRQINNAFRSVINELTNPRETLIKYLPQINTEISYKRNEFGLD